MQLLSQYKGKRDFMNFFLAAKEEHPELVSDNEIVGYLILNILGGADTTAILLKACIYHILKNASVAKNLSAELRAADLPSPAPYEKLQHLPYLSACITEALRFHPVVGHVLERIVPSTGLTLSDGTVLPPGTIVGVNPWVTSRDTEIYGADAEVFRPERWLKQDGESEEEYQERTKRMRDADLSFGAGKRTCLGRPLALIELYKVVGGLFGEYDVSDRFLSSWGRRRTERG
jgi:cytochrome P450